MAKKATRKTATTRQSRPAPPIFNTRNGRAGFNDYLQNALLMRQELISKYLDPRREINDECGYLDTGSLTPDVYRDMFDREAIAARVIKVLPRESWQVQPTVYEDENPEVETEFEKAWDELGKNLRDVSRLLQSDRGESKQNSWYQDERGSPIWEFLKRADELSGIGHYGVIYLGFDDVQNRDDLGEEVEVGEGRKLLFIRLFDEASAQITTFDSEEASPRFGSPLTYQLSFNDPRNESPMTAGPPQTLTPVHWTRCIHIADNLIGSEVFGVPRMRPVWNRLYDLRKLYSGCAEMYWRGAFPGLSLETHPQLGGVVDVNQTEMKNMMEQYMNGLQRYLQLVGMSAKSLAPQVVDPTPQIDTEIQAICIELGIPQRIFMGSERGELASSQDDSTWNDRIHDRRINYLTPRVIVPFVDRLIQVGVLPEPKGYSVEWPNAVSLSPQEQAVVTKARVEAMSVYVSSGAEALMAPMDFLTRELGYDEKEAEEIIKNAMEAVEEKQEEADARAEEFGVNPETETSYAVEEAEVEMMKQKAKQPPPSKK